MPGASPKAGPSHKTAARIWALLDPPETHASRKEVAGFWYTKIFAPPLMGGMVFATSKKTKDKKKFD